MKRVEKTFKWRDSEKEQKRSVRQHKAVTVYMAIGREDLEGGGSEEG